jgi:hypothetical protein
MATTYTLNLAYQTVLIGTDVTLAIRVVGSEPMRRAWSALGIIMAAYGYDRNLDTLVFTNVVPSQASSYRCTTTNEVKTGGGNSSNCFLAGITPPMDTWALSGAHVTLRAQTAGLALTYQWRRDGTNMNILGATTTNLLLTNLTASQAGRYEFAVNNTKFTNVYPMLLTVQDTGTAPAVLQPPTNKAVTTNMNVVLSVKASGTDPLSFQWSQGGTNLLPNGTNAYLVMTNLQAAQLGSYQVVITNAYGAVTSAPALIGPGQLPSPDADNDGIPDAWEQQYGLSGGNPNDASQDADGDGLSNLQEYLAGTNPTNALSTLKLNVLTTVGVGTGAVFEFSAAADKSYTVQYRDSLVLGNWQKLFDVLPASTNRTIGVTNSAGGTRFLRLATPQLP